MGGGAALCHANVVCYFLLSVFRPALFLEPDCFCARLAAQYARIFSAWAFRPGDIGLRFEGCFGAGVAASEALAACGVSIPAFSARRFAQYAFIRSPTTLRWAGDIPLRLREGRAAAGEEARGEGLAPFPRSGNACRSAWRSSPIALSLASAPTLASS
jgi:hypothetical protein